MRSRAASACARVIIIDDAAGVAAGKALDIQQSGAIDGFHVRLDGTDDLSRVVGGAVCVVADRFGRPAGEWQGDEGLAMVRRLVGVPRRLPQSCLRGASQSELSCARRARGAHPT